MAKRGRPVSTDTCHAQKPQGPSDSKIHHCQRRVGHRPPHSAGPFLKWTDSYTREKKG